MRPLTILIICIFLPFKSYAMLVNVFNAPNIIGFGSSSYFSWQSSIMEINGNKAEISINSIFRDLKNKTPHLLSKIWDPTAIDMMLYRIANDAKNQWNDPKKAESKVLEILVKSERGSPELWYRFIKVDISEGKMMQGEGSSANYSRLITKKDIQPQEYDQELLLEKLEDYFYLFAKGVNLEPYSIEKSENGLIITDIEKDRKFVIEISSKIKINYENDTRYLDKETLGNAPLTNSFQDPLTLDDMKQAESVLGVIRSLFYNHKLHPYLRGGGLKLTYPQLLAVEEAKNSMMAVDLSRFNLLERKVLIQAATGTGKSNIIGAIIKSYLDNPKNSLEKGWIHEYLSKKRQTTYQNYINGDYKPRFLFVTHYNGVIEQLYLSLYKIFVKEYKLFTKEEWKDISYLYNGQSFSSQKAKKALFVFTSPGAISSDNLPPEFVTSLHFDMVFSDEGHHSGTQAYQRLMDKIRNYGMWYELSATPFDPSIPIVIDKNGISILTLPTPQALQHGYISSARKTYLWDSTALKSFLTPQGIKDFKDKTISRPIAKKMYDENKKRKAKELTALSVDVAAAGAKLITDKPDIPTMAFVPSIDSAYAIAEHLRNQGVAVEVYASKKDPRYFGNEIMKSKERQEILKNFRKGKTKVLLFVKIVEGLNFDFAERFISFVGGAYRPNIQKLGRLFRIYNDKELEIHFLNTGKDIFKSFLARGDEYLPREEQIVEIGNGFEISALKIPFIFGPAFLLGDNMIQKGKKFRLKTPQSKKPIIVDDW